MNSHKTKSTNSISDSKIYDSKDRVEVEVNGVRYGLYPNLNKKMEVYKIQRSLMGLGPETVEMSSMSDVCKKMSENGTPISQTVMTIVVLEQLAGKAQDEISKNLSTFYEFIPENELVKILDHMKEISQPFKNAHVYNQESLCWDAYMKLDCFSQLFKNLADLYMNAQQAIPDPSFRQKLSQGIKELCVSTTDPDNSAENMRYDLVELVSSCVQKLRIFKDDLELNLFQEAVKEIEALKEKQNSSRAYKDAQIAICKLLNCGDKRSPIVPNNRDDYSVLDTQFSLTEYLKNKRADFSKFSWKDQAHRDAYNAAFADAFTRYYQELHKHMKSHSKLSQQNSRTYYTVNRPGGSVRGQDEFEFSFEKNPQKDHIAVIDSEIEEIVSSYQTAFFILESIKPNNNTKKAQQRYKKLKEKFEEDIEILRIERAFCKNTLSNDLKKDIPQAPTYHVIVSSQKVLEICADAKDGKPVRDKELEWEEGYLKQIFSLQTIINCLRMLTRVIQRYVSMVTSPHHRHMNQKNADYNTQQLTIKKSFLRFSYLGVTEAIEPKKGTVLSLYIGSRDKKTPKN